jgi:hypothetical protein
LFGGTSNQKVANGAKVSKPAATLHPGEKSTPPRPVAAQSKQTSSPLMDLMDMSSGDSFPINLIAKPSYDLFKELEGLLDGPSTTASSTPTAPLKSIIDFMSLYDNTPVVSHSNADFLSLGHISSFGMEALNKSEPGLMDLSEVPITSSLGGPHPSPTSTRDVGFRKGLRQ